MGKKLQGSNISKYCRPIEKKAVGETRLKIKRIFFTLKTEKNNSFFYWNLAFKCSITIINDL